jgi:hypothetical protein
MQNSSAEGFRLSPQQRNLWELLQPAEGQPFRTLAVILIKGNLQPDVLKQSLQYFVAQPGIRLSLLRRSLDEADREYRASVARSLEEMSRGRFRSIRRKQSPWTRK